MKTVIFSGTTEGRQLSEMLSQQGIFHHVCVATGYGSDVMEKSDGFMLHVGRMDDKMMRAFLEENGFGKGDMIVDATHPYATDVSRNIDRSKGECTLIRVRRDDPTDTLVTNNKNYVNYYESMSGFANAADNLSGNILITTGSKELSTYCGIVSDEVKSRTFVRVLPAAESLAVCEELGIDKKQIIAMHGPFSYEMNKATMSQYGICHLLTKESGTAGGFEEKISAAADSGVCVHIISRPKGCADSDGITVNDAFSLITGKEYHPARKITLAGIGMGSPECMTEEVRMAIRSADALFGASRMIEAAGKIANTTETYRTYRAEEIMEILSRKVNITRPVILFSGDTGISSGAAGVYSALRAWDKDARIVVLAGISSVSYLAAKVAKPYDDAKIVSVHGNNSLHNMKALANDIISNKKVFALVSGDGDVRTIARLLTESGTNVRIIAGCDLSYESEQIINMSVEEACDFHAKGSITVLFIKD